MRVLNGLLAMVLRILAVVVGFVGPAPCVAIILIPLAISVIKLDSRRGDLAGNAMSYSIECDRGGP